MFRPFVFAAVFATTAAAPVAVSAQSLTAGSCALRQSSLQNQITQANNARNAARSAQLQGTLNSLQAQCSNVGADAAARAAQATRDRQYQNDVLTRQRELQRAEASGDVNQVLQARQRLNQANTQLNRSRLRTRP